MRMFPKILSALALSAALSLATAATAFAGIVYEDDTLTITGSGEYAAADLFDNFKNVMPGDELSQAIIVTNADKGSIKVYLRAEAYDEESDSLAYNETVATMQDFLSQLHMTVAANGMVVFDAQPHLEDGLSDNVLIGSLKSGETITLDVDLLVPIEMGSEYMNRVGEVRWVFVVEDYGVPLPGAGGNDLSDTGDNVPIQAIAVVALLAVLLAVLLFACSRRNRG